MIKYSDVRDVKFRYTDQGEGRVVVLLHGFMESLEMWKDFSKELSRSYRVICIDLPGFGETPSIGYIHTMELMAKCVKGVMDNLRLRRYVIVGHSMGGYVGLAFAELFPENISGLCLFNSTAAADTEEKKKSRDTAISIVKQKPRQYMQLFFAPLFAPDNVDHFKNEIGQFTERASNWTSRSIVNSLEGMKVRDSREWMMQMSQMPVGFIIGKYDAAIPYEAVLKQAEAVKKKRVLFLENSGHMGFIEAKDESLKFVKRFTGAVFRKKI